MPTLLTAEFLKLRTVRSRCGSVSMSELLSRSQWLPAGGPGLARGRSAGFLFPRDVPGGAGSYCPSGGVLALGPTGREFEQVRCGVDVPVKVQAAAWAGIRALGQGQFGFHCAAARAGSGAGEPPAGDDQLPAVPGRSEERR